MRRTVAVSSPACIIGVGNATRGDDGAGIEAVGRLHERAQRAGIATHAHEGEALALIELWRDATAVVLLDALRGGGPPGRIVRAEASSAPLPALMHGSSSTHAVCVSEAIELSRALERLPASVVVLGVVGRSFELGEGLSQPVRDALGNLAEAALEEAMRPQAPCRRV